MEDKLFELIRRAAEETNEQLATQIQEKVAETTLFGPGGVLDSLALVSLIVTVEAAIEDEFGVSMVLADERAMSQKNSPFRTVEALADYIAMILEEENVVAS